MRVLVLSHMYPRPYHAASGIFVHEQVRFLRAAGIDARVLTGEPFWASSPWPHVVLGSLRAYRRRNVGWTDHDTVPVLQFPYLVGGYFRPWSHAAFYSWGMRRIIRDACRDFAFDVVHAHTSFLDGTAGATAARLYDVPLVITEHTGPFRLITGNALTKTVTGKAVAAADRVFAVSHSLAGDMQNILRLRPGRIGVLPNGVDPEVFRLRHRVSQLDGEIRGLWVGHHVKVKRVDRLIAAFRQVADTFPKLSLSLLGDGELKPQIAAAAGALGSRVRFLSATDRAGVASAMAAHDFLVVSSEAETFGLVALEALCCGVPVLTTACGGPQDVVSDDRLGRVVPNSVEGLARGLAEMAGSAGTFDPIWLRRHAESKFSWTRIAADLAKTYRQLVANRSAA